MVLGPEGVVEYMTGQSWQLSLPRLSRARDNMLLEIDLRHWATY